MQLRFTQFAKILFLIIIFNTPAFLTSQSDTFRPLCTSISAKKTGINKIQITWKCPSDFNASSIAIFRDNKPITLKSTVSAGHPVAEVPANFTSYTDSLKKYGEYYYALIARDKNGNLYNMLFPTVNTTEKSVKLEAPANLYGETTGSDEQYVPGFLRELPLPYLDLISDLDVKPTKMSNKASNAGYELAGEHSLKKTKLLSPYIFEDDLICAPDGDDFYLFESLKTYFIKKDYAGSVKDLKKLLSVNRDSQVTIRAVFYLAESQYYCKNYRKALELFLFVEDFFPELSKKWIDSTLDFYQIPVN